MPLREDLLEPVADENPSGNNLYYDKIFDQIREARIEEDDSGSAGAWQRAAKKADHVLVIKLAGETLAKRTKDLRLAGWLVEAHLRREGIGMLGPCLELLWKLQERFWETIYPEIEEDGDLGLRVGAIESPVNRIGGFLGSLAITKNGFGASRYAESRKVGYEKDADSSDKVAARNDAVQQGLVTAEDFDSAAAATPKAFFVSVEAALDRSLELLDQMGLFQEEKYGDDYPSMNKLITATQEVRQVVSTLLNERRQTEPDVVLESEPEPELETVFEVEAAVQAEPSQAALPRAPDAKKAAIDTRAPATLEQAYAAVLNGVVFLQEQLPESPVPYLVCSGLRFGETRAQATYDLDFAIAPATETRQAMKRLANDGKWSELLLLGLRTMAEPCARVWLDLQRYLWRGAVATGSGALATAIVSTVRGLLQDLPEMQQWTLNDDTPVANAETQQWIAAEILPPSLPVVEQAQLTEEVPAVIAPAWQPAEEEEQGPDIYEQAVTLLQRGKAGEAIKLLVRDAELQPSGRTRFQRRVQVAQLCLAAEQGAIAYPMLVELSKEIERRGLETWETGEMLAHPLSLLLRCLHQRGSAVEDQDAVFERLCRLDPQAAMSVRS